MINPSVQDKAFKVKCYILLCFEQRNNFGAFPQKLVNNFEFVLFWNIVLHAFYSPDVQRQQGTPAVATAGQPIQQTAPALTSSAQLSSGVGTVGAPQSVGQNVLGQQMVANPQIQSVAPAATNQPPTQVEQASTLKFFGGYRIPSATPDQSTSTAPGAAGAAGGTPPETASGVSFRSLCAPRQNM